MTEALQDALYGAGYISVAQEDVVQYLIDKGVKVHRLVDYEGE